MNMEQHEALRRNTKVPWISVIPTFLAFGEENLRNMRLKSGSQKTDHGRTFDRRIQRAKALSTEVGAAAYLEEEEQFRLLDLEPTHVYTGDDLEDSQILRRIIKLLYRERVGRRAYFYLQIWQGRFD